MFGKSSVLAVALFCLAYALLPLALAEEGWWNANWMQRKEITIHENFGLERIDEPFDFNVSFNPGEVSDCNQLRVTELRPVYNITNFSRISVGKILYQNFEPNEGNWIKEGGAKLSTDRYKSSSHSMYLARGNLAPSSRVYTNVTIPSDKGDIIVFGWVYPTAAGRARPLVFTAPGSASNWRGPYTYMDNNKRIVVHDGENGVTSDSQFYYQTDTWLAIRYVIHPETKSYDLYYDTTDGTQLRGRDFPRPRFHGYGGFLNETMTFESLTWNENDMDFYIDDIFIAPASIWIKGVKTNQKVELYSRDGLLKASCTVSNNENCTLNVWNLIFPFKGYFKVYNPDNSLAFTSENYTDIWGGDVYFVNQAFMENKEVEVPFRINGAVYCNESTCSDEYEWKTLGASDMKLNWKRKVFYTWCNGDGNTYFTPPKWMFTDYDDSGWESVNLSNANLASICGGSNCDFHFRKVFYIDGDIEKADITFSHDDGMRLWVNGMWIGQNGWNGCWANGGSGGWSVNIKNYLRPGLNVIGAYVTHWNGDSDRFDITSANITYKARKKPIAGSCTKADISVYTNLHAGGSTKFFVYYNSTNTTSVSRNKNYEYRGLWSRRSNGLGSADLVLSNPHDHEVNLTFTCWNRYGSKFGTIETIMRPYETFRLRDWMNGDPLSNSRCSMYNGDRSPVQWRISATDKIAITQDEWGHLSKTYVPTTDKTVGREFQGSSHSYNTYSYVVIANPTNETASVTFQCWKYDRGRRGRWTSTFNQKYSYRTDQWGPNTDNLYSYGSCGNGNPYRWRVVSDKDIIVFYDEYDGREAGDLAFPSKLYMGQEFVGVGTNITGNDFLRIINPGPPVSAKFECWDKEGISKGPWNWVIESGYLRNTYWFSPSNIYSACGSNEAYQWRLTTNDTVYVSFHSYDSKRAFTSNVLPYEKMVGKNFWIPGRIFGNNRLVFTNPQTSQTNVTISCWAEDGTKKGSWAFVMGSRISNSTLELGTQDFHSKCSSSGRYITHVNSTSPIIISYWEWDGNSGDFDYIPQAIKPTGFPEYDEKRLVITGPAELLQNGSIKITKYGQDWILPAKWDWEWNQTDSIYAGEKYYKQKRIYYNDSYNFIEEGSPYFNITGWVLNQNATCARFISNFTVENCSANISEILSLGADYIYLDQNSINRSSDILWDNEMPFLVPLPIKEGLRRQDFSQITKVNDKAFSLLEINVTNNASAEGLAANFTNVIIRYCPNGFNCTGFTRTIDAMEVVWSGKSDDAVSESLAVLRREGSYSMNLTYDSQNDPTSQDAYFNGVAAVENLTDFSTGKMGFWLYISNVSSFILLEFELGDSPNWNQGNWIRFRNNSVLENGWQYVQFDMNSPSASSGTTINWASVYPKVRVAGTTGPQAWILIDDWRIWITSENYTLSKLNDGESKTEYRLLNKNAIVGVTGANNDWKQDISQTTIAGGTAYIEGNLKINNTDNIVYENVSLPANQPEQSRTGWICSHPAREILTISNIYTSSDYPIKCNKNNVVSKVEGSWAQKGLADIDSQSVNKSVTITNTDYMVAYNSVSWSVADESSCWSTKVTSGQVNLAPNASTIVEAWHSGDCIGNSLSNWKQYMSVVSDEIGQYIAQNITITNNANTDLNIMLKATDFSNPSNYFTPVLAYSDPTNYDNPILVGAGQTVIKRQVSKGDVLSQNNGAEIEEKDYYERIVTVTCVDACDKLLNVKLTVEVNDTNYTDFKIYRKSGGAWVEKTSEYSLNVANGIATWYTNTFGSTEEYKIWGNSSMSTAGGSPSPPEISIISPQNQSYPNNWVWANVSLNDSANWCGVSLDGGTNQTMNMESATKWYKNISVTDGTHSVRFWCNGTSGAMGVSEEKIFTVDSSLPVVTIILPSSGSVYNSNSGIKLDYTVSIEPNVTWYVLDGGAPVFITGNTTFNVSGDGQHNITVFANDSLGKIGSATVNFNTDTASPLITIESPLQQNYSSNTVWFNVSLNEAADWCGYTLDGTGNFSMIGDSSTHFYAQNSSEISIGEHAFTIYCNDSAGNMGMSSSSFNFSETVPNPPSVTILLPENTSYNYKTNIPLDYITENNPDSCKYYVDGSGPTSIANCINTTFNVSNDGAHNVTIVVTNAGGSNSSSVIFTIDTIVPTVNLYSPANGTYTSVPIELTYTVSEDSTCAYSLNNGNNNSISGNTSISPSNGDYNITLYCTDPAGNTGKSNSSYFTVNVQQQQQSTGGGGGGGGVYIPPTKENETEEAVTISLEITAEPASLEIEKGTSSSVTLSVINSGTGLADIELVASGVPEDWVDGLKTISLGANEVKDIEITVSGKEIGNWTLSITALADSESASISIPLNVIETVVETTKEVEEVEAPAGPGGFFGLNIPTVSTEMIMVGGLGIIMLAALGVFIAMMRRG